jgi:hypothetical protein
MATSFVLGHSGGGDRQMLGLAAAEIYNFDLGALAALAERIGPTPEDLGQDDAVSVPKWEAAPWLVYLFFALIVIGPMAVARSSSLDELLADRRTLAELLISQKLPGFFAYPAAFGDIAVGVTACVAVIALIWSTSTAIPVAWSVLGLLDFVGAVGTGFLASQAVAVVHTDPPTSVFTQWPMVLFPAYMVPFSTILHITTIRVLLASRRRPGERYVSGGEGKWIAADGS